jgi:hypothetical protein
MLKRIVLLVAAIAAGIGLAGGASVVAAKSAPAIVEAAKAPISPMDTCACGGSVTVVGRAEYCSSPDFLSVLTWYSNGSSSLVTYFEPVRC